MVGMALYVVPKTSRRKLFSFRLAYVSLALINLSVFVGDLMLMGGINNGGQEYREYIWPVQAVFAIGVILTAYNLIRTIATSRKYIFRTGTSWAAYCGPSPCSSLLTSRGTSRTASAKP
jgi:cbb3-type cytochrome oxidase subunit 1